MADYNIGVLYIILVLYTGGASSYDVTNAEALFTNLTTGYNIQLRPSQPVIVSIEFSILSINTLDVKQQIFSITGYITASWIDSRLTWTATDYGNITNMFFTEDYIWKPELVIQNSAINVPIVDNDNLSIRVIDSGSVSWDPPGIYIVNCDVDVTYYPFDTQTCYVTISTWAMDSSQINLILSKDGINFEDFQENGEWTLLRSSVQSSSREDRNEADRSRSTLSFLFTLERKTEYYILNVLLPPMLTSFLGLMVFVLPAESGEKVGFCITVLLALAVLLTIVTDYIPSTSKNTSLYGVYLVCNLFISALEVIITIIVLQLHHRADRQERVPYKLQRFANTVLARITCNKSGCRTTKDGHTSESIPLPKRSQISPNSSSVKLPGSKRAGTMPNANSVSDVKYEQSDPTDVDDWKDYSWVEVAAMVDKTAFIVMFTIWAVTSIVFIAWLTSN